MRNFEPKYKKGLPDTRYARRPSTKVSANDRVTVLACFLNLVDSEAGSLLGMGRAFAIPINYVRSVQSTKA